MHAVRFILIASCAICVILASRAHANNAIYIPYDVADAIRELDEILEPSAKTQEQLFSRPIGMQVRNRWRLWNDDSRLAQYFNAKGIYNADIMWGIVADAFQAKLRKKPFVLKKSIREALSMYPSSVNIPTRLGEVPPDFKTLHISHYIQRDDLSAIHVFATSDGKPKWVFIPGAGWSVADKVISSTIGTTAAIVVPQPPANDSTEAFPPILSPGAPKMKP